MGVFKLFLIVTFILLIIAFSTPVKNTAGETTANVLFQGPCGTSKIVSLYQTLSDMAAICDTTIQALISANPSIQDPNIQLPVGQRIMMPGRLVSVNSALIPNTGGPVEIVNTGTEGSVPDPPVISAGKSYTVQPGDTLSKLAVQYNTNVDGILGLNPSIKDPNLIYTGQILVLP